MPTPPAAKGARHVSPHMLPMVTPLFWAINLTGIYVTSRGASRAAAVPLE